MPGHAPAQPRQPHLFNLFVRKALGLETTDMLAGFWIMERERVLELKKRWEIFYGYGDYYIRFLYACRSGRNEGARAAGAVPEAPSDRRKRHQLPQGAGALHPHA